MTEYGLAVRSWDALRRAAPPGSGASSSCRSRFRSSGFDRCEQLAARRPESEETARCFDETGKALQQKDKAAARLQELLRQHPGSPWLTFFLSYGTASVEDFSRLAATFSSRGEAKGEVISRSNLYRLLFNAGRVEEAAEVERMMRVAQASGDAEHGRAKVLKARYLWGAGKDLEGAYVLLLQAEPALFPEGSYPAQRDYLLALANLDLELGRSSRRVSRSLRTGWRIWASAEEGYLHR